MTGQDPWTIEAKKSSITMPTWRPVIGYGRKTRWSKKKPVGLGVLVDWFQVMPRMDIHGYLKKALCKGLRGASMIHPKGQPERVWEKTPGPNKVPLISNTFHFWELLKRTQLAFHGFLQHLSTQENIRWFQTHLNKVRVTLDSPSASREWNKRYSKSPFAPPKSKNV